MSNYRFIHFETIAGTVHHADMLRKSSDKTYGEKLISLFARREEEKSIIGVLFDIGMEYDVIFSPLFASGDEWEGGIFTQFPVYEEIMKDGAIVA